MNEDKRWIHLPPDTGLQETLARLAADPDNDMLLQSAASKTYSRSNPDTALKYLDKAISLNPGSARAYFLKGGMYSDLERHAEAIQIINQGIAVAPTDPQGPWCLAFVYSKNGDRASALLQWQAVIDLCDQVSQGDVHEMHCKDMARYAQQMLAESGPNG